MFAAEKHNALGRAVAALEDLVLLRSSESEIRLPSERDLAKKLDVSRSTVREALQRLVARGVLETKRGSGAFVASTGFRNDASLWGRQLSTDQRGQLFEVRTIIESSAARLAAHRSSADDRDFLNESLAKLTQAVQARDPDAEASADRSFHAALVVAAHNSFLTKLYQSLNDSIHRHISLNTFEASHSRSDAYALASLRLSQHRTILECISMQDAEQAYRAVSSHLEFVQSQFRTEPHEINS